MATVYLYTYGGPREVETDDRSEEDLDMMMAILDRQYQLFMKRIGEPGLSRATGEEVERRLAGTLKDIDVVSRLLSHHYAKRLNPVPAPRPARNGGAR